MGQMDRKRPSSGQGQGSNGSSGGCQGTGPSPPRLRPQLVPSPTSQHRPCVSDRARTLKGPPRPSHPQAPGQARQGLFAANPSPSGSHLQPFPERHPPPAAAPRLPKFLGLRGFPTRWRQRQRQRRLGREGARQEPSQATALGQAKQTQAHAKEPGRNSSQMRKSCFRVGPRF